MIPSMTMQTGYDPHQTTCPLCKNDAEQIVIGTVYRYTTSRGGHFIGFGHAGGPLAHKLLDLGVDYEAEVIGPYDKVPADRPCPDCEADLFHQRLEFEQEVINGGLHWRCVMCGKFGVIVANDSVGFCENVRGEAGIEPPTQMGVRFENCIQHATPDDANWWAIK